MILIFAASLAIALVLINPAPAFAWGPVTHIALGIQMLATVITPDHPLQAALLGLPEVFLYGSLAPDIVQGRRLQSRLRRHSHNWTTGLGLLESANDEQEKAFALGYCAHLSADVVAHNFFLPARFIGRFDSRFASHIYAEARFDSLYEADYRNLLVKLLAIDFAPLNAMLDRAIDSPLISFSAHRRIFEGGLRRIRQWDRVIKAIGAFEKIDPHEAQVFQDASCSAIAGVLEHRRDAPACLFDPMGRQALRSAMSSRRNLQRLNRMGPAARKSARELAAAMLADLRTHLQQTPFGPSPG
jgi:Zinc dependent phospholipase C